MPEAFLDSKLQATVLPHREQVTSDMTDTENDPGTLNTCSVLSVCIDAGTLMLTHKHVYNMHTHILGQKLKTGWAN